MLEHRRDVSQGTGEDCQKNEDLFDHIFKPLLVFQMVKQEGMAKCRLSQLINMQSSNCLIQAKGRHKCGTPGTMYVFACGQ